MMRMLLRIIKTKKDGGERADDKDDEFGCQRSFQMGFKTRPVGLGCGEAGTRV